MATSLTIYSTVEAQTVECTFDARTRVKTCRIVATDLGSTSTPIGDGGPSAFIRFRDSFGAFDSGGGPGPAAVLLNCPIRTTTAADGTITEELGVLYWDELRRADDFSLVVRDIVCTYPGEPAPPPPLPPPTEGEFREAAADLLTIDMQLNPQASFGGITGLETWFWCTDPGDTPVAVSLRGWTAEAEMTAIEFNWAISNGDVSGRDKGLSSEDCGSEPSDSGAGAAVTWLPETKGLYAIDFASTWAGTWTLSYLGNPAGIFPLGPFDFEAETVDYDVDEFVGVLSE